MHLYSPRIVIFEKRKVKMMNRKMISALLIAFAGLIIIYGFSIPTAFLAVLLGLLLIPPALLFAYVFITGIPVIANELKALLRSGKEMFIISVSKESIVLEHNLDR